VERVVAALSGEHSLGGQESSGQADDEEHRDHADEDQDDYRPGLHDSTVDGRPGTPLKRCWTG